MRKYYLFTFLLIMMSHLFSCSSVEYTQDAVLERDNAITRLHDELQEARADELQLMAPIAMQAASDKYDEAIAEAKETVAQHAGISIAQNGLADLARARQQAQQSQQVMAEAFKARDAAVDAEADNQFPERLKELDSQLTEASAHLEKGEPEKARVLQDSLLQEYQQLERNSLKKGLSAKARRALKQAESADADDYAPKSFAKAEKQLALMEEALDVNRKDREKAQSRAKRAKYLAERAKEISTIIKSFERRDYSREDMVLWYHDQLNKLADKLNKSIAYNRPNREIIDDLAVAIDDLQTGLKEQTQALNTKQAMLDAMDKKLMANMVREEREAYQRQQKAARFSGLENMFRPEEAKVVKTSEAVIIQAHGIYFPVGSAELEVQNYPLLSKIVDAISQFNGATIKVYGHTDATGQNTLNLRLSKKRAANVSKFLTTVGMVDPGKVTSSGFGELKPVASNNTERGRRLNRRIEIHIKRQ